MSKLVISDTLEAAVRDSKVVNLKVSNLSEIDFHQHSCMPLDFVSNGWLFFGAKFFNSVV